MRDPGPEEAAVGPLQPTVVVCHPYIRALLAQLSVKSIAKFALLLCENQKTVEGSGK